VAIIGIIAAIGVPMLMDAIDRSKQRRSMGDMRTIAAANGTFNVDQQNYAPNLAALVGGEYLQVAIINDGWGNPFVYNTTGDAYDLTSQGSDGAAGPAAPMPWFNDPFEPDIVMADGAFTQRPEG
jgi:general secretion pathway protein G